MNTQQITPQDLNVSTKAPDTDFDRRANQSWQAYITTKLPEVAHKQARHDRLLALFRQPAECP